MIADLVAKLIAAGTPPDVAAVVVTEAFAAGVSAGIPRISADVSADKRRERDRIRKQIARENPQKSAESADIPQTDDSALTILEVKQDIKQEKKVRAKPSRGETLPPDAKPTAEHFAFGLASGFNRDWVDQQFEDMRIWARTNEHRAVARKSDWNLTFTGWLRRAAGDAKGRQNGNRTGNPRTTGHDAILAVAARKARELDRNDEMAGTTNTAGFAFGDGIDRAGPGGNPNAAGPGQRDHQRFEPDDQRIREGEIIPPDKDAVGIPRGRQFV